MTYKNYINLKYKPNKNDLICTFKIIPTTTRAMGAVAAESSTGTWSQLSSMSEKKMTKLGAKVFKIKGKYVKIAYPSILFEKGNIPQLLSSVAGNVFGMKEINTLRLEDIELPKKYVKGFRGPKYGIKGIRKFVGHNRVIIGSILKPKLGLTSDKHARLSYEIWKGGLDIAKDDENLSNQNFNRFEKRITKTLKMKIKIEKESKENKVYLPNITAETNEMIRRAKFVKKHGGEFVMVDYLTVGFSGFQTIKKVCDNLNLRIHLHRASYAAYARNPDHGISMMVLAKLARLIGGDQLHTGGLGKMFEPKEEVVALNKAMKNKWYHIKPTLPVASGGLWAGDIPRLVNILGKNIIIQAGGGVNWNPRGSIYGAMGMRQAADAVEQKISLKEYAKTHRELREAIKHFS